MARRQYAGAAVETTITGAVASSGAVTVAIAATTGWPDGATGPFAIVVDPGTATEEKMLVTERIGSSLTVAAPGRGYDGTSAIGHASGAVIYLTYTAVDFDEANAHINATSAAHAATAISNTPAGSIAATTVQAALNELDSEKAAASHTHSASAVTDFDEAARDALGAAITAGSGISKTVNDGADSITIALSNATASVAFAAVAPGAYAEASDYTMVLTGGGTWDDCVPDLSTDPSGFLSGATFTVPAGLGGTYQVGFDYRPVSPANQHFAAVVIDGFSWNLGAGVSEDEWQSHCISRRLAAGATLKFQLRQIIGTPVNPVLWIARVHRVAM